MTETHWIDIKDKKPELEEPITAVISYQGKETIVNGCYSSHEDSVVVFYSGTGGSKIIKWIPRELPKEKNAHPWCGIENNGL